MRSEQQSKNAIMKALNETGKKLFNKDGGSRIHLLRIVHTSDSVSFRYPDVFHLCFRNRGNGSIIQPKDEVSKEVITKISYIQLKFSHASIYFKSPIRHSFMKFNPEMIFSSYLDEDSQLLMTVDQYGIEFRRRWSMEDKHQVFLTSCLEHPLFWVPNKVDSEHKANMVALQHVLCFSYGPEYGKWLAKWRKQTEKEQQTTIYWKYGSTESQGDVSEQLCDYLTSLMKIKSFDICFRNINLFLWKLAPNLNMICFIFFNVSAEDLTFVLENVSCKHLRLNAETSLRKYGKPIKFEKISTSITTWLLKMVHPPVQDEQDKDSPVISTKTVARDNSFSNGNVPSEQSCAPVYAFSGFVR
ncbi:hypothetical protein CAEBREN_03877 [Caenorhabditis brenneri]|uniref:Uncharacterized protein n=1 Tax=Caenorhabditis brenneri TaxID=135651 RepID=G0N7G3_CAEBE|nr:hypothetical protein CAEBREN_03877 [Caenorhabditis brenneri]